MNNSKKIFLFTKLLFLYVNNYNQKCNYIQYYIKKYLIIFYINIKNNKSIKYFITYLFKYFLLLFKIITC